MSKRVALYCRYSDQKQARRGGVSSASQLKNLRDAARDNHEIIVEELIDQARTGTEMLNRKEYLRLIELARTRQIDLVRLEDVSRGNRNEFDRLFMERELGSYGVDLLYLGEDPNAPPEQRMIWRGIKGNLAQFESHQTSQRVYKRTRYRAEQGRWRGGSIPYGLKPDNRGWFVPDPETYPYLLYILERRSDGCGYRRITGELNKGISLNGNPSLIPPTPGMLEYQRRPFIERIDPESGDIYYIDKRKPAPNWNVVTIKRICKQAVDGIYAGVLNWGRTYAKLSRDDLNRPKTPVHFIHDQPLIPEDLLASVRNVEAGVPDRQRFKGRPSTFLLKPTCARCGGPMRGWSHMVGYDGKNGKVKYQYRYYVCVHAEGSGGVRCVVAPVDANYVDQESIRQICAFAQTINREEFIREFETGLLSTA
jgi:DNA invertase Pin-like site-specific DNA recombinase